VYLDLLVDIFLLNKFLSTAERYNFWGSQRHCYTSANLFLKMLLWLSLND